MPAQGGGGSRSRIDFAALIAALLQRAEQLVPAWLPGGKRRGKEWVCGNLTGGKGDSCSVNLVTGGWADFAGDDKGNDLLSLYAAIHGIAKQGDAARQLLRDEGWASSSSALPPSLTSAAGPDGRPEPPPDGAGGGPAGKRKSIWRPVVPVPEGVPAPTFRHSYRKAADLQASWAYRFEGQLYGHVARFRTSDGGKDVLPHTWCVDESDQRGLCKWHWMQWDEPRPLYVPRGSLSEDLQRPVVVVEGEKKALAGHELLGAEFDFVSWPGGSKAWHKAAWGWLMGRTVYLWPDCDAKREDLSKAERDAGVDPASKPIKPEHAQPGMQAMVNIGALLQGERGCTVYLCPIPAPGAVADGWDLADAVAEGWGAMRVRTFIRGAREFVSPADAAEKIARRSGSAQGDGSRPGGGGGEPPEPPDDEDDGPEPAWFGRRQWDRKKLADCRENVYLYLTNHADLKGLVAYDEFAHRVIKMRAPPWKSEPGEWTTNDDYLLGLWLAEHCRFRLKSEATVIAGVAMAAWEKSFHPVREHFKQLPEWDGTPRLAHWLHECLGAKDSDYEGLVGAWFVMGICQRVLEPGCQMDYMVVLEGLQGKRKSTALRVLAIRDEWFADTPVKVGAPDALLSLAGKVLTEIGELESFNKAEVTAIKQYISSRVDRVREPYARRHIDRPRSGVLTGSTNQAEYLKDSSGGRRFWPVACGAIDIDKLREWRPQLYAEALVRLASSEPEVRRCWPTRAETATFLEPEQEQREIADPWFERIAAWVNSKAQYADSTDEVWQRDSFSTSEILAHCLRVPIDRIDGARQMATRVGACFARMRPPWLKRREGGGDRLWRYHRPAKDEQHRAADGSPVVAASEPESGDEVPF